MRSIQVLSLDCWGTLIEARPSFWQTYAKIVKESVKTDKSPEHISRASKKINDYFDNLSKINGKAYSQPERIRKLLKVVSEKNILEIEEITQKVINMVSNSIKNAEQHFKVLDEEFIELMKDRNATIYKLILSSNTGFISGKQTTQILNTLGLNYFDHQFYSDEVGASKPSEAFINKIIERYRHKVNITRLIHIGDDKFCDDLKSNNIEVVSYILKEKIGGSPTDIIRSL